MVLSDLPKNIGILCYFHEARMKVSNFQVHQCTNIITWHQWYLVYTTTNQKSGFGIYHLIKACADVTSSLA